MAKAFEAHPTLHVVVGTLGGNSRNRVIVRRQLNSQVVGIPDMQEPPIPLLNCHAAMTESVTEQWDQQHFR